MTDLVWDLGMEIIYGTDRFSKEDIDNVIEENHINREELRRQVAKWIDNQNFPLEATSPDFIEEQLNFWIGA